MKRIKVYGILFLLVIMTGIGVAILMKTDLGLGPWDATALTFSYLLNVKLGTMGMIINIFSVFLQILILGKKFNKFNFLQIPISLLLGNVINIFGYTIFSNLVIENYILKIIVCILITVFIAIMVAGIVELKLLTFPAEGLCTAISEKWGIPFSKVRQSLDYVCLLFIIVFTLIFSLKWTIRESTIISALVFPKSLAFFLPRMENLYKKWSIVD